MIVLVLAPHTDDEALGCGGTIARHVQRGDTVHTIAFSNCGRDDLLQEAYAASRQLGTTPTVRSWPVRRFPEFRQEILEHLVSVREQLKPDVVYLPCSTDRHQDHEVIHNEGFRAFKHHATIYGYELPWNCVTFHANHFVMLDGDHIETKIAAVKAYASQTHRPYVDPLVIKAQALVKGVQCKALYAESFELIRSIQ